MIEPITDGVPTLHDVLACAYDGTPVNPAWSEADAALARCDHHAACQLYAQAPLTDTARAKVGFCLAMLGKDDEVEAYLTPQNVGAHPVAQALLAWSMAGTNRTRLQEFGSKASAADCAERRSLAEGLIGSALSVERPPLVVFAAAFNVLQKFTDEGIAAAERARTLYPQWPHGHAVHFNVTKTPPSNEVLDLWLREIKATSVGDVLEAALFGAMSLERYDDADRLISTLEERSAADESTGNLHALIELRALVLLLRGRKGDANAVQAMRALFEEAAPIEPTREPIAAKFRLQAALDQDDVPAMIDAAGMLLEHVWTDGASDLDFWMVGFGTSSVDRTLYFDGFTFTLGTQWQRIAEVLSEPLRTRWTQAVAADAVLGEWHDAAQVEALRQVDVATAPLWLVATAIYASARVAPMDAARGGAIMAAYTECRMTGSEDAAADIGRALGLFDLDGWGDDTLQHFFNGAIAWLESNTAVTGTVFLRRWGDDLLKRGQQGVVGRVASLSLARNGGQIASDFLERSRGAADPLRSALEAALARFPDPSVTRVHPAQLSLLEAATLIALVRATQLDHASWTLSPLREATQPFEPTRKFIGTLFELKYKGVICIDRTTPAAALELKDGQLRAFLDRVVWRISANTLALYREIRDLPRASWPDSWRHHAPVLARDLGVEELVAYFEHLFIDRELPLPDLDAVRDIFRVQTEKLALSQCYYLIHKTTKDTLDYRAKYRSGARATETRSLTLLRGNGERAIEQGWDTRYRRIQDLPPSLLFEALHDVLTGWGQRAFDEPLMSLDLATIGTDSGRAEP